MVPCTSPNCYSGAYLFLDQCLERAAGDKEKFCDNVTNWWQDSRGNDIFETHCKPHSEYESECEKLIGRVGSYCSRII